MRRSLKWFTWLLASMITLVVIVALILVLALRTHTGTRWTVDRISALVPGELVVEQFDGSLWSGLQIPRLNYHDAAFELRITEVELSIDWSSATLGQFVLQELSAESVDYRKISSTDAEPGAFQIAMEPLPLTIGLRSGTVDRVRYAADGEPIDLQNISVNEAFVSGNAISVNALSAETQGIHAAMTSLESELAGDVPVNGTFTWSMGDGNWSGSGDLSGSLAELQLSHVLRGLYPAMATGSISLLNQTLPEFDLLVSWNQWSFDDVSIENGETRIRGTTEQYDIDYQMLVELLSEEQILVTGTGRGDTARLSTFAANLSHQAADVELDGTLAWSPAFSAEARVHATDIDPSIAIEQLTGRLNADTQISIDNTGNLFVENAVVSGTLNDAPVNSRGSLLVSAEQIQCDECLLNVGDNQLSVDGGVTGDIFELALSVDAADIESLWPGIGGSVVGEGQFSGTRAQPDFSGEFRGQQLRVESWSAEEIVLNSRVSTLDSYDLTIVARQVAKGETGLGSFDIDGEITQNAIVVSADWRYRELSVSASADATRSDEGVTGSITSAHVDDQTSGTWTLEDETEFEFKQGDFVVAPHTWSNAPGQLRVERLSQTGEELELAAFMVDLPLEIANVFMPPEFTLRGSASANVDLTRNAGIWRGAIIWEQSGTVLNVRAENDSTIEIEVPVVDISAELENGGASASARLEIEPGVNGELDFDIEELNIDSPIQAEFRLSGSDWNWVPAVVPTIDKFAGSITATLSADGPLMTPTFGGSLNWNEGSLAVPALNVPISEIDVAVVGMANGSATINGSAKAGDGNIAVTGRLQELMHPSRNLSLEVRGNDAELINWPEYRVWASPDIVISGNNEGWTFEGAVGVPRAEIDIRELPEGAVVPSEDVTVIGRTENENPRRRLTGDARLVLGEDVHVQALGLDTNLRGDLTVSLVQDRAVSADGRITLVGGSFSAYGQELTIDEGTLTFTGPLDNPIVDVRAIRVIEAFEGPVTAGIHLRGRAQSLSSTVYSDPVMADAEALSYLMLGRPLEQASGAEGDQLSVAAIGLGVKQAARVTEQIGQALGLDQLTLAGDGGDTTALVAGKQLNSRLHARYAYGVFSRLGTLLLRYQMTKRLTLEAGAGEEQSIDLLYLVEKQ